MKLYTYQGDHGDVRILQREKICEVCIYTSSYTFSWFLVLEPEENTVWFLETVKNHVDSCLTMLLWKNYFVNESVAKQQLTECLQELSTLSTKDFDEYICTRL